MALTLTSWATALTAGNANASNGPGVANTVGDMFFGVSMSIGAQGALGMSDNAADGLGAYTKILDVDDSATTSRMTLFARNAAANSTDNVTWSTTNMPVGATAGAIQVYRIQGGPGKVGAAAIRQTAVGPSMAANASPTVTFAKPFLDGNGGWTFLVANETGTNWLGPSGWSAPAATTIASPATWMRPAALISPGGNVVTWGSTPTVTFFMLAVEVVNSIEPVHGALMDLSKFPKGGNR